MEENNVLYTDHENEDDTPMELFLNEDEEVEVRLAAREKIRKNMKNLFFNPVPKKIKFSDKALEPMTFTDVYKFMDLETGSEAYASSYTEIEFLAYMYKKKRGFYPEVLRIANVNVQLFVEMLFKHAKPPENSYIKTTEINQEGFKVNMLMLAIKEAKIRAEETLMYVIGGEAALFYDKKIERDPSSNLHLMIGLLRTCTDPVIQKNKIYVVYSSDTGFSKMGFNVKKIDLDLKQNYNDGFEEVSQEIINGLNDNKKTNLVILSGEPGTGKTTYIRYLTSKIKKNIIFISPDMVNQITDPAFIPFLMKNNNTVLIIEDAEPALQSRNGDGRTSAVSNVLNLTDGLLSDCLNISIIATFNTGGKNIDPALLRKGRLLKNYKFDRLSIDKSKSLLEKLGHSEVKVDGPMTLSDIYFYASDPNTCEFKSKKVGF